MLTIRLGAALLALTLVGCTNSPRPAVERQAVPPELVGVWNTFTPSGSAFSYDIAAEGVYLYVGIMRVETLQTTLQEDGRLAVAGDQLTLAPQSTVIRREDPTDRGGDYERATQRPPRTMTWTVTGDRLTLSENGESTTYQRE